MPSPDSLPEAIAEAKRLYVQTDEPLQCGYEDDGPNVLMGESSELFIRIVQSPSHNAAAWGLFLCAAHGLLPKLIAAYEAAIVALEASHRERDKLEAQLADRNHCEYCDQPLYGDGIENEPVHWTCHRANLQTVITERDALRETRSELNLRINRALAALAKGGVDEAREILNRGSE